jgi:hypothetical protein
MTAEQIAAHIAELDAAQAALTGPASKLLHAITMCRAALGNLDSTGTPSRAGSFAWSGASVAGLLAEVQVSIAAIETVATAIDA